MKRLALIFSIVLTAGAAHGEEKHCQLQTAGELTLDGGQMVTEARINDQPVHLIVDTGAFGTLLFASDADHLGLFLRHTGAKSYGVGGEADVYSARVKAFQVGDMVLKDADLVVAGRGPKGIEGVLGAKFLMQADIEFDQAHGKVRFFRPRDCVGDQVVYWGEAYAVAPMVGSPNDEILVRVSLNGVPIVAKLDSGAGVSALTPGAAARAGVAVGAGSPAGSLHGMGPEAVPDRIALFQTFGFGDETIKNAKLSVADMFAADKDIHINTRIASQVVDQPQMMLGADFLRSHRVYVALSQHRVYVTYVGGPVFDLKPQTTQPAAKP